MPSSHANPSFTATTYGGACRLPGSIMRKPAFRTSVALVTFVLAALLVAGCSTLNSLGAMLGSQVTFTQPQLQHALNRNFPKEYDKLGGLVSLRLTNPRSEEHTSELQSLMRTSYAVFCLKKKNTILK